MRSRTLSALAAALLFAVPLCLAAALPAKAQDAIYTVTNVHVDATAASSSEALNAAITQGRAKAFQILYRRLTRQADWARQPPMDAASLLRLTRGSTTKNERRSTTRYVADVTYLFNPTAVERALRAAQIAFSQGAARPILVIPMSPGVTHGPWAQALMSPAFRDSQVPFTVSSADDETALSALNFDSATWNDVSGIAAKYHVTDVGLAQAIYANGKMAVNIRRLSASEPSSKTSLDVPMQQTVGTTYPVAAQAAVRAMEDMWKTRSAIDLNQRGHLTADVHIASLEQWGEIQTALGSVSNVTSLTVTAMDISYARVNLTYQGGLEQLREACAGAGLTLSERGGQWTLAKSQ
jgi:hypothetical protein